MIKQQRQATERHEGAPKQSRAGIAWPYLPAKHERVAPSFLLLLIRIYAGVNIAMNLIVEVIAELFRIEFLIVVHAILL